MHLVTLHVLRNNLTVQKCLLIQAKSNQMNQEIVPLVIVKIMFILCHTKMQFYIKDLQCKSDNTVIRKCWFKIIASYMYVVP